MSYSEDLTTWTDPELVAISEQPWEDRKVGAGATPMKTDAGWLLIFHGVDNDANYRTGLMLLDLEDPSWLSPAAQKYLRTRRILRASVLA